MAAGSAAKLTVSGGDIEAIQSIGGAQVNISGGSVYCEGVYYALYNGGGNTSISGGYFYSPTGKNIYVASGTVKLPVATLVISPLLWKAVINFRILV